jgi:hypothetical protein
MGPLDWLAIISFVLAIVALTPVVWQYTMDYVWFWPFWITLDGGTSPGGSEVLASISIRNLLSRTAYYDLVFIDKERNPFAVTSGVVIETGENRGPVGQVNPHDRLSLAIRSNVIAGARVVGVAVGMSGYRRPRYTKLGYRPYFFSQAKTHKPPRA